MRNRREAYDQIEPRCPNRKAMILDVLTSGDPGGMTADEIGEKLVSEGKIPTNSPNFTRPRLTEMKAEGKVVIVGRRPGKSGCNHGGLEGEALMYGEYTCLDCGKIL